MRFRPRRPAADLATAVSEVLRTIAICAPVALPAFTTQLFANYSQYYKATTVSRPRTIGMRFSYKFGGAG
jgi:hypothetical protein